MAKQLSKAGKRFLSIIFHLIVLVIMVNAYDAGRAVIKTMTPEKADDDESGKGGKKSTSGKATDKKTDASKPSAPTIAPIKKGTGDTTGTGFGSVNGIGKQIGNKLNETRSKMDERGTSMEDLLAEKERREKAKAAKAAEEAAKKAAENNQ